MTKIICLYLPQYHEFEENNKWWGKGFTEWTCLKKAKSLSKDHRIRYPHDDIGYYCLLDYDVRKKQAEIARKYNIYGFCYYHYWFYNKTLMDEPLNLMLKDGEPNLNFCFSWANEPWTRRMNGGNGEVIQPSKYGNEEEWNNHLKYLFRFFKNKNYIKKDNCPIFFIYRVSQINNYKERFKYYNEKCKKEGFDGIKIFSTIGNFDDNFEEQENYVEGFFDFQPNFMRFRNPGLLYETETSSFYDTEICYKYIIEKRFNFKNIIPSLFVGFDSSPRNTKRSNVFLNNNPFIFGKYLRKLNEIKKNEYIFINAWNEWGEGASLEPEIIDGYSYLEQLSKSLIKIKNI